ncbi:MAG TPA: TonB-dependent receptor [Terriglobales bacterium]|jgi:vitamin B12 transporter|nr:TonB-dependent receptor [Terriglobales bacterium]
MPRFSLAQWSICTCVLVVSLAAQVSNQISGQVVDPDHAAIPRATVRLLSPDRLETARVLTDQQGRFAFQQTCQGTCVVEVQLTGFQTRQLHTPLNTQEIQLGLAPIQEQIVVTANRTETPEIQLGSTSTTISHQDIVERQPLMLSDALHWVPGATVIRSGALGATTSLFIRGGESNYTKVLLDGIPLNEPGGAFDLGSFAADGIDRVEIVRGPQSALFGSDAMTGVVQVFSDHGATEEHRPQVDLNFEAGKYNTLEGGINVKGGIRDLDYSGFYSRLNTDNQGVNDDFRNSTGGLNVGFALGKRSRLRWIARGNSSRDGTPGQTAFGRPDTDAFFRRADGYTGVSFTDQTSRAWEQRLTYTFERSREVSRDIFLDPPFTPTFGDSSAPFEFFDFPTDFLNDTRRHHLGYQSDLRLGQGDRKWGQHIFTLAFDWDHESGFLFDRLGGGIPNRAQRDNFGGTFQYQTVLGRLFLSNGFRVEDNGSFGRTVVPRSSAALLLRQGGSALGATKVKFNCGLGIKEPSFTQSFSQDPAFLGNPNLRPERSRAFEVGVEQRLLRDRAKIEVNWFDNNFRDLIAFKTLTFVPFTGTFLNINATHARGVEFIAQAVPVSHVHLTAEYTYLSTRVEKSATPTDPILGVGKPLLRRPKHSATLSAVWDWQKATLSSSLVYVGRRADSDFEALFPPLTNSSPYTNWNLAGSYRVSRQLSFVASIENLLDRTYMEALGFPALRIAYRVGVRVHF